MAEMWRTVTSQTLTVAGQPGTMNAHRSTCITLEEHKKKCFHKWIDRPKTKDD